MVQYYDGVNTNLRRVLGDTLRSLRERRGWSLRDLSEQTTYNHTYFGRVETADQVPSEALARTLDELFDTGGLFFRMLEAIREGSMQHYGSVAVKKARAATRIEVFTSGVVPGFMQTEGYARALFAAALDKSTEEIEASLATRMKLQRIFEADEPPLFWSIMDESVLKRLVGGNLCMVGQLERLIQAAQQPNVIFQVFPFDWGEHPMLEGSLTLLSMPDGKQVAYVENFVSGELVESPRRVVQLGQRFDVLRANALKPEESLTLIRKYLEEYQQCIIPLPPLPLT